MTHEARCERTARLLSQRLDELATALERAGAPAEPMGRLLELASVATMHAVSLELLSSERASSIWRTAVEQHPVLEQLEPAQRLAA
ncbi:MAG: hypothetical protein ACRDN6_12020 [Gaiellaceae bacterium]